jgi:hypothetical protein
LARRGSKGEGFFIAKNRDLRLEMIENENVGFSLKKRKFHKSK